MNFKGLHQRIHEKQKELNDLLNDLNEQLALEQGDYSGLSIPYDATHYRVVNCKVEYIRKCPYQDDWDIWLDSTNSWLGTFWKRVEVGKDVKLLTAK